jgi:hypothetical protein
MVNNFTDNNSPFASRESYSRHSYAIRFKYLNVMANKKHNSVITDDRLRADTEEPFSQII